MKQRLILFSALLIMSLLIGVASAAENDTGINVTYSETDVIPYDVVSIIADFNTSVANASISITNNTGSLLVANDTMNSLDSDDNSFVYNYTIPLDIISGPLAVDISAFDANNSLLLNGEPAKDPEAFTFNVSDYLSIDVTLSKTGLFRPGDEVNITANFSKPVDKATISITDGGLPQASNPNLVTAELVNDAVMTPIDEDTFGYNYVIPEGASGLLDMGISGFDELGNLLGEGSFPGGSFPGEFEATDPYIEIISPISQFANGSCVKFNFTGNDYYSQAGDEIVYTFSLDGVQVNNGIIAPGEYKQLEFTLADGKHTWEIQTNDSVGEHTTGIRTLYVDTKCPVVTLTSPQDCFKQVIGETQFNFTCEDALADQYRDLGLSYILYVDGQVAKRFGDSGTNITGTATSGVPVNQKVQLADGVHNWSVSVKDEAGNSAKSEVRKFYVDLNGLRVSSLDPNNGKYVSSNPTFNFTVTGGAGLPFNYRLLVDGKEVLRSNCDGNCNGGYSGDEGEDGCVCVGCSEGGASCFVVGQSVYSLKASVSDGVNKNWTVIITDITTGKEYPTNLQTFNVDSVAPACVANLSVKDIPGETYWNGLINSPGLYVSWNASTEKDLAAQPYDVLISSFKPNCIEDMEKVESTSNTSSMIVNCTGKPLIYGKDYWVAVIARDNASNYEKSFSMCGPVQTYEDMDITLGEGWNLKSVPRKLIDSDACPEKVFGNGSTVIYWDGSCWQFPSTIEPCKGYWVYTKEARLNSVKLKGMSSDSANPDVPPSLILTPGWHMIGHTSTLAAPWPLTLASLNSYNSVLGSDYKFSNLITYGSEGWGGIIPDATGNMTEVKYANKTEPLPVAALQVDNYMVPGQGYWVFMKSEGTYASIENVYNPYVGQDTNNETDDGTDDGIEFGTFPEDFDPNDQETWPDWLKNMTGQFTQS